MKSLLWKDYRLARPLLILAGTLLGVSYLLGAVMEIKSSWPAMPSAGAWGGMLVVYGSVALYLTAAITGLLGGHAIACERADRTAHFLGYLPPTKTQILASKLAIAAIATTLIWVWLLGSVKLLAPWLTRHSTDVDVTLFSAVGGLQLCALTFGVGWLGSAVSESTIVPIIMALASPVAVGLAMLTLFDLLGMPRFEMVKYSGATSACVGLAAFLFGTWRYYRRVEP
jgi:ABC-type transport system involved in multi-copper enzyme maturation permease subunit